MKRPGFKPASQYVRPTKRVKTMAPYRKKQTLTAKVTRLLSNIESKVLDNNLIGGVAYTAAGTVTLLNGIAEGSDNFTRDGKQVTMTSVLLRSHPVSFQSTGGQASGMFRCMLVLDMQPNGALAAVTDILVVANPLSPQALPNRERFLVLYDEITDFSGTTTGAVATGLGGVGSSNSKNSAYFNTYKKLDFKTIFNGTGASGTIAQINTGALLMLQIANATGAGWAAADDTFVRVRFNDY